MAVETEYYHSKEAATAHLQSVGLTLEGFTYWMDSNDHIIHVLGDPGALFALYSASRLREYIREHNTL